MLSDRREPETVLNLLGRLGIATAFDRFDPFHDANFLSEAISSTCHGFTALLERRLRADPKLKSTAPAILVWLLIRMAPLHSISENGFAIHHSKPVERFGVFGESWHRLVQVLSMRFGSAFANYAGIQSNPLRKEDFLAECNSLPLDSLDEALVAACRGGKAWGYSRLTAPKLEELNALLGQEASRAPLAKLEGDSHSECEIFCAPPERPTSFHFERQGDKGTLIMGSERFALEGDQFVFVKAVAEANGRPISAAKLGIPHPKRVLDTLPDKVRKLIVCQRGKGCYLKEVNG